MRFEVVNEHVERRALSALRGAAVGAAELLQEQLNRTMADLETVDSKRAGAAFVVALNDSFVWAFLIAAFVCAVVKKLFVHRCVVRAVKID